ncbi:MAG: hypothetical protein GTN80_07230 [Nitrososphaeria archaeon]|nr:hypothetical protein [Nitrososphaeria archaeon]NIQ33418.1 hypothetical protein [Nitrososphaeria archaeon]
MREARERIGTYWRSTPSGAASARVLEAEPVEAKPLDTWIPAASGRGLLNWLKAPTPRAYHLL